MWYYGFLADVVVFVHLSYVAYVLIGQLLIILGLCCRWSWVRNIWFRLTHLSAILIVAFETLAGFKCPLTTLEEWLRGSATHASFIGRLLDRILFYSPEEVAQETLNLCYLAFALVILATFFLAPPRWRKAAAPQPAVS
jgi:hypothetical protein